MSDKEELFDAINQIIYSNADPKYLDYTSEHITDEILDLLKEFGYIDE
jgi:hypothetical protein